jgi:hypothetical protein
MNSDFYSSFDLEKFFAKPLWYKEIPEELKNVFWGHYKTKEEEEEYRQLRRSIVSKIGELLDRGKVKLAKEGMNFDEERKEVDSVIVHHTGSGATEVKNSVSYMNALHMVRLYVPQFLSDSREYSGRPMWSNHFRDGKMVFYAYHYLVYPDGNYEKLLKDEYIGWHCGRWSWNKRSIAVCFLADLTEERPTQKALLAAKEIISDYSPEFVLGHREVNHKTICPGDLFLGEGGWKKDLVN